MTLPGGAANKLGNRYEKWWAMSELVRMLQGETEALRIEAPGIDKAEFVVTAGRRRELHQVRRSHPNDKWSLAALRTDGLLNEISRQLRDNDDRFAFVSASHAGELADLCEAARNAESLEEFRQTFLAAQERSGHFEKLLNVWACDDAAAHAILRRIEVHTIDESELEQKVNWGLQALFLANPDHVSDALRGIVEDSVHRTLTRQSLVDELSRRGYQLRHLTNPQSAGAAIRAATDRYLSGARARLIRQRLVPREASQTLLARVNDTPAGSVLTGRAGSGKTGCVVEFVEALRERGAPVMAFRIDRFVSAGTTTELGKALEVEDSPSLVLAEAAKAAGRTGFLVVDQLDSVSTASGRSAAAFDLVERLLEEARGSHARAAIHVVVVCREFDWNHDHRLRALMPKSSGHVTVAEFTVEEVKKILADAAFEPGEFQDRQLKILQLPQNLSLFLQAGFDAAHAPIFRTAKELFDRYWDDKRRILEERAPAADSQWMGVMKTLCDEMAATQQLSVNKEKLDTFSGGYVAQLASEGVLTFDGRRYGFGHESFFDYVFARLFVNRSETVAAFLKEKESEQHLFRRAQVRQVLTYLREADFARYLTELRGLLDDNGIRTHLKDLIFALLAEVTDPTEEEWAIWQRWIDPQLAAIENGAPNPDKLSALAWRWFMTSRSWFAEADRRGLLKHWLASGNDRLTDTAVNHLRFHQRHAPDRVALLLEPYADLGGKWRLRFRSLMRAAEHHASRRFFELFLQLIDNGTLDDAHDRTATDGTFWGMVYGMGEGCPEWVPEVVAGWLHRRFHITGAAGKDMGYVNLFEHDAAATELMHKSSRGAPAAFVKHVLPTVLEISDATAHGDTSPRRDAVWPAVILSDHPSGDDACILALAGALATLARDGAPSLDSAISMLRGRNTYVANHLLMTLYSGGAERHADEAIRLLCEEPWRFQSGLFHYDDGCATAVVRTAVPHCSVESRERLEEVILHYVSADERSKGGYKQHGQTRLGLLSAFPEELRSARANKHRAELNRKFAKPAQEHRRIKFTRVESPIDEAAAGKMTDGQWLRAIAKYGGRRIDFSGDTPRGGALQLARLLGKSTKADPDRFARLGLRLPTDANPIYLQETLSALQGAAIPSELKLRVCCKAFEESRESCGRETTDVLSSIEDGLPDDAVHMLHRLATRHADPAAEAWRKEAGGGDTYDNDILNSGINTTRGRAAEAIRVLVFRDAAYVERFRDTLDRLVQDPSAAVRACVAGTLYAVANRDPALGVSLFMNMDLSEERLFTTPYVYNFILASLRERFAEMLPFIERMLRSSAPEVRQAGGRLAGIAALLHESAAGLAAEALRSDAHGRRGVAEVASANVADPDYRSWCEERLVSLFNDAEADVRLGAAWCFGHVPDETLGTYGDLITAFCDSRAFEDSSVALMRVLERSRGRLPRTTCAVCEKFCERVAGDRGAGGAEYTVAKLVFRIYQQHQHDEWTTRALDLIDRLCLEGIPSAASEFEQFER